MSVEKFAEEYNLKESLGNVIEGGSINKLLVMFRLPVDSESTKLLRDMFGPAYINLFPVRTFTADDYGKASGTAEFYCISRDVLVRMPNEKLAEVFGKAFSVVLTYGDPCPLTSFFNEMLASEGGQVAIIVFSTIATISSGGLAGWQLYAVIGGALLQIAAVTEAFGGDPDTNNALKITGSVLQVYGAYHSFAYGGSFPSVASTMGLALTIANAVIDTVSTVMVTGTEYDMQKEYDEQSMIRDEMEAIKFEKKIRYVYGDSYDSTYREGHERHPHTFIREYYRDYAVFT